MMNFTSNHCGVSIGFYFKACYPVSVYVATFKVTLKNIEVKPICKATVQKETLKKFSNVHLKSRLSEMFESKKHRYILNFK